AEEIIQRCHKKGVKVLVDAAQSVPHMKIDIQKLDCDFFAFSAHKMLGPTGVGVLWARKEILENMQPFNGGGDMIREVHKYETSWNDLPYKFEAGTPNIADVIGFSAAIDYLENIGMDKVREHEIELTKYALDKISAIKGIKLYGTPDMKKRGGVISFNLGDIHPHDLATIVDEDGVAIRSGHHCAQVLMERLDVSATSRASFYIYNTKEEVDVFIRSLNRAKELFRI
ncbi:MAG: aminotransferase class V-fold PLP-dependent enzyme, partial [Thermoproteota archaeon]